MTGGARERAQQAIALAPQAYRLASLTCSKDGEKRLYLNKMKGQTSSCLLTRTHMQC